MSAPEYGLSLRFKVVIDEAADLGTWTKCDGLSFEYDVQEIKEGGNNDYVHKLPGRMKHQNLKLTRPIDDMTARVAAWLTSVAQVPRRGNAVVTVLDTNGTPVFVWRLAGVYPVKWSGPSLDVGSNTVAMEVLELVHNGMSLP
jgi:phage tail-like protein